MSHAVPISIVIPTWNAGEEFPAVLDAVLGQEVEGSFEILVIDSGSTDDTVATARRCGCRVLEIAKEDFDHGLTRQMGVREATGNLVVLMTQDARPADSRWLAVLVEPFSDPRVAGAYSAQEPRADASPFIRDRLLQWAAGSDQPRVQEVADPEAFAALPPLEKLSRVAFDNVSSCVRREVALRTPFRRRQFGEDLDWAHRAILEGHRVVFQPRSRVVHSHNRSIAYEFARVYLDHANLHRLFAVHTVPTGSAILHSTVAYVRHLWRVVEEDSALTRPSRWKWKARAMPYALTQNLAQYLGAKTAIRESGSRRSRWLPVLHGWMRNYV